MSPTPFPAAPTPAPRGVRVVRRLALGASALALLAATLLVGQGMGEVRGAMVGLYAASLPATAAVGAQQSLCEHTVDAQLAQSNPDGSRLNRGETVTGKTVNDVDAQRYRHDRGVLSAICLLDGTNPGLHTQATNLLVISALSVAAFNGLDLPPNPQGQAQEQELVERLGANAGQAFSGNVLTKLALAHQMQTACTGLAGQLRCLPWRVSAAAYRLDPDATLADRWHAFLHPQQLVEQLIRVDVSIAARVDSGVWKLAHPAQMAGYNRAMATQGPQVALKIDPTPTESTFSAPREKQVEALRATYNDRSQHDPAWKGPF